MLRRWADPKSRPFTLLLGLLTAAFVLCIVVYPDQVFQSSLRGLKIWWDFVFPALLPFMIVSELMIGFGVVHGLGMLFEPLMRTAFRIPGAGGWALALGITAGYPLGAGVTAQLRRQGQLRREEAERLAAVSHIASPMLMIAVVGVGFLHSAEAGFIIALIHYASAFAVGLMMRRHSAPDTPTGKPLVPAQATAPDKMKTWLVLRAVRHMKDAYSEDGRTFGKLLGDAVGSSIQTLLILGGFIMIFNVLLRVVLLQIPPGSSSGLLRQVLAGLLEPHLGAYANSLQSNFPLKWQAALIGAILAWSGLSVHAQVRSLIDGTDIRYAPFFVSRLLHGALAFTATIYAWEPLSRWLYPARAAFAPPDAAVPAPGSVLWQGNQSILSVWGDLFVFLALFLAFMLCLSFLIGMIRGRDEPAAH